MFNRADLRAELRRDEGCELTAYKDTLGYWTIGVGHLLGAEQRMSQITPSEADALLDADINAAVDIVIKRVGQIQFEMIDDVRQRALINMAFNLGPKLLQFKRFLSSVDNRDWTSAAREMMESLWAKQVGLRAIRLRRMIETGIA